MPVILIRHGQAAGRREWHGDDRSRPLTDKGRRQALGLPKALQTYAPQRVLASPYRRCIETVEPLASQLGLSVEITEDLAEGSGATALALVRALADEKVALCTHGDVIPDVLVPLADEDRVDLGHHPKQAKGCAWVLEHSHGSFIRATYLPPSV
ncbi:MAG: histidine phosphatase family protein [Acidimicrobiaceae bacterium]|nr:histidine phosphatase family protein [Acidimicrobiaceae bacterium]